jgi:1-acyl-sn-glycerol-3-phosphate acyltransferase
MIVAILRGAVSLLSVLLVGLYFVLGSVVLRLFVQPGCWLFPRHRQLLIGKYMKAMSAGILACLRVGGARARRVGVLPTAKPCLVVANHQSLLDICQATLLGRPRVAAFVTRKRYERFVPLVSTSARLLGGPFIDPKRDPKGALDAIQRAARELPHGVLIFAEGHRSSDGRVRPFRPGGIEAILAEQRLPVYLVVNDGTWRVRRLLDLLFRVHLIDAYAEVLGPFAPPADASELRAFVASLRERIVQRLAEHRRDESTRGA